MQNSRFSSYQLNPKQKEAISYSQESCLVVAGAGSGKTSVITRKIVSLLEQGIKPLHLVALTFTIKASEEMKSRVGKLLTKQSKGLQISTFHGFALNILERHAPEIGYKKNFSLLDAYDSRRMLREVTDDYRLKSDEFDKVVQAISLWKSDAVFPHESCQSLSLKSLEMPESLIDQAWNIYESYANLAQLYNAMDFDDLLLQCLRLFKESTLVRNYWNRRIEHILIDEYQDTNRVQYQLFKALLGPATNFTLVGDDDQAIYGWRGARSENLQQVVEEFPHIKVVKLEQNYRSSKPILDMANKLILENKPHFVKKLWSTKNLEQKPVLIEAEDDFEQASRVSSRIHGLLEIDKIDPSEIAVLYRSNHQAKLLEIRLQALGIDYEVSGGASFYAREEVKDIIAYLRFMDNPMDDAALLRIINVPKRGIGEKTLKHLLTTAHQANIPVFMAMQRLALISKLGDSEQTAIEHFCNWYKRYNTPQGTISAWAEELLGSIDYYTWLLDNTSSQKMAERKWENVQFLLSIVEKEAQRRQEAGEENDLGTILNRLMLRNILEQKGQKADTPKQVQLMTIHSAKGLEFEQVFLLGLNEGSLPHHASTSPQQISEERRLFYVGITRAKNALYLYRAKKQSKAFQKEKVESQASRFLEDISGTYLDAGTSVQEKKSMPDFAALRASLGGG